MAVIKIFQRIFFSYCRPHHGSLGHDIRDLRPQTCLLRAPPIVCSICQFVNLTLKNFSDGHVGVPSKALRGPSGSISLEIASESEFKWIFFSYCRPHHGSLGHDIRDLRPQTCVLRAPSIVCSICQIVNLTLKKFYDGHAGALQRPSEAL